MEASNRDHFETKMCHLGQVAMGGLGGEGLIEVKVHGAEARVEVRRGVAARHDERDEADAVRVRRARRRRAPRPHEPSARRAVLADVLAVFEAARRVRRRRRGALDHL